MTSRRQTRAEATGFRLPKTVSRPELLVGGSDHAFRTVLYDLSYLGTLLEVARTHLATQMGLTSPQYNIVMVIAEFMGERDVSVSDVAAQLHVSGAFVTMEVNKLVDLDLVEKVPNPADGRGILLRLTPRGKTSIQQMSGYLCRFNDQFFGALSKADFERLGKIVAGVIKGAEATLHEFAPVRPLIRPASRQRAPRKARGVGRTVGL